MPRYFFVIHGKGNDGSDAWGTHLPNAADALSYPKRIIGELRDGGGFNEPGLSMSVESENGKTLFQLPFH
jgi:hypothetical protein